MQKHTWDTVIFSQSASCLSLSMILMLFIQSTCSVATSGRTVVVLGGSWWKWYPAHLTIRSDNKIVAGGGGSGRWDNGGRPPGDGAVGRLLWHSWRSPTFQTVGRLSSHQPTASVINRKKGSHVKKKTFQLQPRELQCRTHMYTHTHIHEHTLTHTNKYTWAGSESKGWFQWQPEWRIKQDVWHLSCSCLPASTALTCRHVKAKHRLYG